MSLLAVNGSEVAFGGESVLCKAGCGALVDGKHGREYCSDKCRLTAWARRQQAPITSGKMNN